MKTNRNLAYSQEAEVQCVEYMQSDKLHAPCALPYPAISKRLGLLLLSLDDAEATIAETTSVGEALAATSTTWLFAGPDAAVLLVALPLAIATVAQSPSGQTSAQSLFQLITELTCPSEGIRQVGTSRPANPSLRGQTAVFGEVTVG